MRADSTGNHRRAHHDAEGIGADRVAGRRFADVEIVGEVRQQAHGREFGDADRKSAHRQCEMDDARMERPGHIVLVDVATSSNRGTADRLRRRPGNRFSARCVLTCWDIARLPWLRTVGGDRGGVIRSPRSSFHGPGFAGNHARRFAHPKALSALSSAPPVPVL